MTRFEETGFLHMGKNKDSDQLCGSRKADQHLCFRIIDSTKPLLPKIPNFKKLATCVFFDCEARFVSDMLGNSEDQFSHNEAHMIKQLDLF